MKRIIDQSSVDRFLAQMAGDFAKGVITKTDFFRHNLFVVSLVQHDLMTHMVESVRLAQHLDTPLETLLQAWEKKLSDSQRDLDLRTDWYLATQGGNAKSKHEPA